MYIRGIRGATTVKCNDRDEILNATEELLESLLKENDVAIDHIASAFFSVTSDLNSAFPAEAARRMGWVCVPLMCLQELDIFQSLNKCIRVLLHVNTAKAQDEIKHIYLREARILRPDLSAL